jgi:hypothetical protein
MGVLREYGRLFSDLSPTRNLSSNRPQSGRGMAGQAQRKRVAFAKLLRGAAS